MTADELSERPRRPRSERPHCPLSLGMRLAERFVATRLLDVPHLAEKLVVGATPERPPSCSRCTPAPPTMPPSMAVSTRH
jgi:hypothetical protein